MFQSSRHGATKQGNKRQDSTKDHAVTILTSGCHFSGKLYCRGASRIGGKIEGEIISEGLLIIEEEAQIFATIKADEAVIQGRVVGRIDAKSRVELCATSSYSGDISSPILIVREGAQFNGRSTMATLQVSDEIQGGKKDISMKDRKTKSNPDHLSGPADMELSPSKLPEIQAN